MVAHTKCLLSSLYFVCVLIITDVEDMFTEENECKLWSWLDVAMKHYRDLVDNCVDTTRMFTNEMWIEQAAEIQVNS